MLLNEFSYHLSVLKNEQHQNRLKLKSLLPHRSIYDGVENPFEKEEYSEEIKKVVVKGGSGDQVEGGDDGVEVKVEGVEEVEEVEDDEVEGELEGGGVEEGDDELEGDDDELEVEGDDDGEVEVEGGDDGDVELEGGDDGDVELEGGDDGEVEVEGGGVEVEGGEEIGGVVFDNLSKEGGTSTMENVKNVVVSFF